MRKFPCIAVVCLVAALVGCKTGTPTGASKTIKTSTSGGTSSSGGSGGTSTSTGTNKILIDGKEVKLAGDMVAFYKNGDKKQIQIGAFSSTAPTEDVYSGGILLTSSKGDFNNGDIAAGVELLSPSGDKEDWEADTTHSMIDHKIDFHQSGNHISGSVSVNPLNGSGPDKLVPIHLEMTFDLTVSDTPPTQPTPAVSPTPSPHYDLETSDFGYPVPIEMHVKIIQTGNSYGPVTAKTVVYKVVSKDNPGEVVEINGDAKMGGFAAVIQYSKLSVGSFTIRVFVDNQNTPVLERDITVTQAMLDKANGKATASPSPIPKP